MDQWLWGVLWASAAGVPSAASDGVIAHLCFESPQAPAELRGLRTTGVRFVRLAPGQPTGTPPNQASARFDGHGAIVSTGLPSNHPGLGHGFTWEGYFLSPARNTFETDGGIGDRFVSQFVDDKGSSTRLAIGLAAGSKTGNKTGPSLSIAFAGTTNRHDGALPVSPDRWHHFALVHQGTGTHGTITWYLDHAKCGEVVLTGKSDRFTLKKPGSAPLTIGARVREGWRADRGFLGLLDEIRFTARPRDPSEFLPLPNAKVSPLALAGIFDDEVRWARFWAARHDWARTMALGWDDPQAPGPGNPIDSFLDHQFERAGITPAPLVGDAAFLRRLSLDARGRISSRTEVAQFLADAAPDKRERLIDSMLASSEWADAWVGYWQDVLAENPSILKPTLNNSGPFRWWIRDSLLANVPMDRFATELILMEGDGERGTAGFGVATNNDVPMAMKAHVILTAFQAADAKCARCHDSPVNSFEQQDLFELAAMLQEKPITVPATSTLAGVPGDRHRLVSSTLRPGAIVAPKWSIGEILDIPQSDDHQRFIEEAMRIDESLRRPRFELAAMVTTPATSRFSDVLVNRVWKRCFGFGLVEPVDDWTTTTQALHPELLWSLSRRFVLDRYDLKALARLIFTSKAYQRGVAPTNSASPARLAAQTRRRLSAEQLVDSLFQAVGKPLGAEELSFDPNHTQGFLNLGTPQRAWQFASLSNERDRPSLSMPVNQSIVDALTTFGWRETRPDPVSVRDENPNPLQPLILANGTMTHRVVGLSEESEITELCLEAQSAADLVRGLFVAVLGREPASDERVAFLDLLGPGFERRCTGRPKPLVSHRQRPRVDWDRHLEGTANAELIESEKLIRLGDPPTVRLADDFRQRVEDALWALLNSPEFVFVP